MPGTGRRTALLFTTTIPYPTDEDDGSVTQFVDELCLLSDTIVSTFAWEPPRVKYEIPYDAAIWFPAPAPFPWAGGPTSRPGPTHSSRRTRPTSVTLDADARAAVPSSR